MTEYIDRLQAVNERLNLTSIRGKEYAEVNQRVLAFWALFPEGRIVTKFIVQEEDRCVCVAFVYASRDKDAPVIASGHAEEYRSASQINRTSMYENAETSAVGRALGMLGIGATTAIASAEEVSHAIEQQGQPKPKAKAKPRSKDAGTGLEAARRSLIDACREYAKATGTDEREAMVEASKLPGFEMTASGYLTAAATMRDRAAKSGQTGD